MNLTRIALLSLTLTASMLPTTEASAQEVQLEPDGYFVQALCFGGKADGNVWVTVGFFDTLEEAEEYKDFLMFMANMGAAVNHRGEVDSKTWEKLLDELDLPEGVYLHGFDYRIIPFYDYSRYLMTPATLSLTR